MLHCWNSCPRRNLFHQQVPILLRKRVCWDDHAPSSGNMKVNMVPCWPKHSKPWSNPDGHCCLKWGDRTKVYYYGADTLFAHHPRVVQRCPGVWWDLFAMVGDLWGIGEVEFYALIIVLGKTGQWQSGWDLCIFFGGGSVGFHCLGVK